MAANSLRRCPFVKRVGLFTTHCHQCFGFPKLRVPPLESTPLSMLELPSFFAQGNQGKRRAHAASSAVSNRDCCLTQESVVFCQYPGKVASKLVMLQRGQNLRSSQSLTVMRMGRWKRKDEGVSRQLMGFGEKTMKISTKYVDQIVWPSGQSLTLCFAAF